MVEAAEVVVGEVFADAEVACDCGLGMDLADVADNDAVEVVNTALVADDLGHHTDGCAEPADLGNAA